MTTLRVVDDKPEAPAGPLPMWTFLAANDVPREHRTAASAAFASWLEQYAGTADERNRQIRHAFPHIEADGPLAGSCLLCHQPWPCTSYMLEVNRP